MTLTSAPPDATGDRRARRKATMRSRRRRLRRRSPSLILLYTLIFCVGGGALTAACSSEAGGDAPAASADLGPSGVGGSNFVLDGAGPTERRAATIKVAAAADLRGVMERSLQVQLEQQCDTRLTFVFGSSGQLKTQIDAGADFGLYLSADSQYPADLARAGKVVPNGTASYAVGRIVLATRAGLRPLSDMEGLTRSDVKRIAIANPDHAPYGRAAKQALENAGLYSRIRSKLVLGENIRQATDYVEKGDADAAIVALALVITGSPAHYSIIDASLYAPIEQSGAVIKGTGAELTGRCILQYLLDRPGQEALGKFGFEAIPR